MMNKFLTKETLLIVVIVFWMIYQSGFFATKLDLEKVKNEQLQQKLELKAYADKNDKEIQHDIDSKFQQLLQRIDRIK